VLPSFINQKDMSFIRVNPNTVINTSEIVLWKEERQTTKVGSDGESLIDCDELVVRIETRSGAFYVLQPDLAEKALPILRTLEENNR
jgi:hypothetical protein